MRYDDEDIYYHVISHQFLLTHLLLPFFNNKFLQTEKKKKEIVKNKQIEI